MRAILIGIIGLSLAGCASEPMSYEEQQERSAAYQRMGAALTGMSNSMTQQSQYNQQQNMQMRPILDQECRSRPNGYGGWVTNCDR